MKNVKIICNKADFAKMTMNCCRSQSCSECVFDDICDDICIENGKLPFLDLVEVIEETKPTEGDKIGKRCITCKWYGSHVESGHGKVERFCRTHRGLAMVTRDTFCSYWEEMPMMRSGDADEKTD